VTSKTLGLSRAQQGKFRPVVKQAWLRHCLIHDLETNDQDARRQWYESELYKCLQINSTNQLRWTSQDFDTLLRHFAALAQDRDTIAHVATNEERQAKWLIGQRLDELGFLDGKAYDWSYAVAIFDHMQLPITIDECPHEYLDKVFQALDTHVRRKLRDRNLTRRDMRTALHQYRAMQQEYS
jgi:hypothetical protein